MTRICSFEPVAEKNAKVLILGSIPGRASLAAGQYYAHPQNAFWRIISDLLQFDPLSAYPAKVASLKSAGLALWDVLQSCTREGSLDAKIESGSEVPNNFQSFFEIHHQITHVFFNGAKAEESFNRRVLRQVDCGALNFQRLPSTSPANAAMSLARKTDMWRVILMHNQPALPQTDSAGQLPDFCASEMHPTLARERKRHKDTNGLNL